LPSSGICSRLLNNARLCGSKCLLSDTIETLFQSWCRCYAFVISKFRVGAKLIISQ